MPLTPTSTLIHSARIVTEASDIADGWVLFRDGTITARGEGDAWREQLGEGGSSTIERIDAAGQLLLPGFIDLHCHGGAGASFDADDPAAVAAALAVHRRAGTTRSVLSLVTGRIDALETQVARIRDLARADETVLGSHLEGPFLADEFRGAHDPTLLQSPRTDTVERLIAAADGTLRQVTLAPERDGATAAIERFVAAGVRVAVGHTATDYAGAAAAFDAGASLLTHAFNGMRGIHHREPGPIGAALARPAVTLELIVDLVHVHPEVVRLAFASAPGRVAMITDAMSAAGAADGGYRLGSLDVEVRDGVARLAGGGSIAGSTLTLGTALANAVRACGLDLQVAVAALTAVPARALGLGDRLGDLRDGYAADAVLVDSDLTVQRVWAAGRSVDMG